MAENAIASPLGVAGDDPRLALFAACIDYLQFARTRKGLSDSAIGKLLGQLPDTYIRPSP
jgi:hypothetical protein